MSRSITFEPDTPMSLEVEAHFDSDDYLERIVVLGWIEGVGYDITQWLSTRRPLLFKRLEKEAVKKAREENFDSVS